MPTMSPTEAADKEQFGVAAKSTPFVELGVTGLKRTSGYVDEEFLPQLRGRKAVQVYREMSENDAMIGALLFTIENLLRQVEWRVIPGGKTAEDAQAAKLVETCMDDMSHSWPGLISEILSCLTYGWSYHEVVYKRRIGPWEKESVKRSKYTDGLIGWRKIPIRSQETLHRWVFDDTGGLKAMVQLSPPGDQTTVIGSSTSLVFR